MSKLLQQNEIPGPEEYCELRRVCGLSPKEILAAQMGLPNSLFAATIRDERGFLVAMGRVVGDGGLNFEVVDIAVHPDFQRQGLGGKIMAAVMKYIYENAPVSAYISLIADDHAPALYRKFGFRPTAPRSIGMAQRILKKEDKDSS